MSLIYNEQKEFMDQQVIRKPSKPSLKKCTGAEQFVFRCVFWRSEHVCTVNERARKEAGSMFWVYTIITTTSSTITTTTAFIKEHHECLDELDEMLLSTRVRFMYMKWFIPRTIPITFSTI